MFLFLALLALTFDTLTLLLLAESNNHEIALNVEIQIYLSLFAAFRVFMLLPLFYNELSGKRLKFPRFYRGSMAIMVLLLLLQLVFIYNYSSFEVNKCTLAVFTSLIATSFHHLCIHVLRTTAPNLKANNKIREYDQRLAYHYRSLFYPDWEQYCGYKVIFWMTDEVHEGKKEDFNVQNDKNVSQNIDAADVAAGFVIKVTPPMTMNKSFDDGYLSEIRSFGSIEDKEDTPYHTPVLTPVFRSNQHHESKKSLEDLQSRLLNINRIGRIELVDETDDLLNITYSHNEKGLLLPYRLNDEHQEDENVMYLRERNAHQPQNIFECFSQDGGHDFMNELKQRIDIARRKWTYQSQFLLPILSSKIADMRFRNMATSDNSAYTFQMILKLFTYDFNHKSKLNLLIRQQHRGGSYFDRFEDDLNESEIFRRLSLCDEEELLFYIPQILVFLIHGAFLNGLELEHFILQKCSSDIYLAHRCYWFLCSFVLNSSTEGVETDLKAIMTLGPILSKSLLKTSSATNLVGFSPHSKRKKYHSSDNLSSESMRSGWINHTNFSDEDALYIYSVCQRIKLSQKANISNSDDSCFLLTPRFFSQLIDIADDLIMVPKDDRNRSLVNELIKFKLNWFNNQMRSRMKSLYVPFGLRGRSGGCISGSYIINVLESESFALSTKERVPCMVVLEVSDPIDLHSSKETNMNFLARRKQNHAELSKWWTEKRHPQRHNTVFEVTLNNFNSLNEQLSALRLRRVKSRRELGRKSSELDLAIDDDIDSRESVSIQTSDLEMQTAHDENGNLNRQDIERRMGQWGISLDDHDFGSLASSVSSGPGRSVPRRMKYSKFDTEKKRADFQSQNARSWNDGFFDKFYPSGPSSPLLPLLEKDRASPSVSTNDSCSSSIPSPPPPVVFKEDWSQKQARVRTMSQNSHLRNWRLVPVFIKSNDDLRQEQLAAQLIQKMAFILAKAKVPVWLYPYEIIALSNRGGIIEAVPNTISISSLRGNHPNYTNLRGFFLEHFGAEASNNYQGARANFVESLAAYSIVCYLLNIKDRHNGNILLDSLGHIVHIDFGFFFLSSPGKNSNFESAPFKLTREFVDLMDGPHSRTFHRFRELCIQSFMTLRRNCHPILLLVDMLISGNESLPCFRNRPDHAINQLRERFKLELNDRACEEYVNSLINESLENWRTNWYDRYQRCCVGVL